MSSVYELARNLGEELLKTPEVEILLAAKKDYEADPEIVKLVEEYTEIQNEFEQRFTGGQTTQEENEEFRVKMTERGEIIKSNEKASALFAAEMTFNHLMQSIFSVVTSTVAGEEPTESSGCNPSSCASCGGGCH